MAKYIDRRPPMATGDLPGDRDAILNYLSYLQDRMNFILTLIYKEAKNHETS